MTYALYLDMDGVFSSFDTSVKSIFPDYHLLEGQYSDEITCDAKRELNNRMVETICATKDFWTDLPWHTEGNKLFQWIHTNVPHDKIAMLTAPISRDVRCEGQKKLWIEREFKGMICLESRFFCNDDKAAYINVLKGEYQILVDDRLKNIQAWRAVGGIGIHHDPENVGRTIEALRAILESVK